MIWQRTSRSYVAIVSQIFLSGFFRIDSLTHPKTNRKSVFYRIHYQSIYLSAPPFSITDDNTGPHRTRGLTIIKQKPLTRSKIGSVPRSVDSCTTIPRSFETRSSAPLSLVNVTIIAVLYNQSCRPSVSPFSVRIQGLRFNAMINNSQTARPRTRAITLNNSLQRARMRPWIGESLSPVSMGLGQVSDR